MIKLNVMVTLPDNRKLSCGEIVATSPDSRGLVKGAFRYSNQIMDEVYGAVGRWRSVFQEYGVPESDIQRLEWGIQKRLKLFAQ